MKLKALALVAAVLMTASCFAACSKKEDTSSTPSTPDTSSEGGETSSDEGGETASTEHQQIEITSTPVTELDYMATSADTSEAVNLLWYLWGDPHEDDQMVFDKLNEMSAADINTTVDFKYADNTKAGLMISTDEYYDMVFSCAWQTNYVNNANKNYYAELDELLPTVAPTLYNFIPELTWQGATVNGHIYGVPVYKDSAAAQMYVIDKDLAEKAGITQDDMNALTSDWNDFTPLLQKLKDNTDLEGVEAPYMTVGTNINDEFDYINRSGMGVGIPFGSSDNKVISALDDPTTLETVTVFKEWLDTGLANKDALTAETNGGWSPAWTGQGWLNCEAFWKNNDHGDVMISTRIPAMYTTDSVLGSAHAISVNSDYVERALLYLQWINCNSEARNIFCYGIEGTHWNKTDEGTVERTDRGATKYNASSFSQATFFTVIPEAPKALDSWDGLLKSCMEATATPLLGFTPNNEMIENEISSVSAIAAQYERALRVGAVDDPAAAIAQARDGVMSAGMQAIIDEYQTQVDEFMASK